MKKAVMIIANQDYQDNEYNIPKDLLEDAGVEVVTAAKFTGEAQGSLGGHVEVDICLGDVHVFDYDAVIFVGGSGAAVYQEDIEAHLIARDAVEQGIVIAAICIAPTILGHAGILDEKRVTVWNKDGSGSQKVESCGAQFVDKEVVVDGKLVTANGPDAAKEFGMRLLEVLN